MMVHAAQRVEPHCFTTSVNRRRSAAQQMRGGSCSATPRLYRWRLLANYQQQKRLSQHRRQQVDRHSLTTRALGREPQDEVSHEEQYSSSGSKDGSSSSSSSNNNRVRGRKGGCVVCGGSVSFDTAFSSFLYALKEVQHTALRLKSQLSGKYLCL